MSNIQDLMKGMFIARCKEARSGIRLVSGHDFSRAAGPSGRTRASEAAEKGRISGIGSKSRPQGLK
ncbi:MAG: hypothetical protein WBE72_23270, partial [Terracidiphilus sp.]